MSTYQKQMSSTYLNFFLTLLTSIFLQTTIFTPRVKSQENLILSNSEIQSSVALGKAITSYEQTKFSETLLWLDKAYANAIEKNDVEQQIQALNLLAMTQQKSGQLLEAQSTIERSLNLLNTQIKTNSDIIFLWSQALNIQGNILFKQGQTKQALSAWQNAQAKAEIIDDFAGVQGSLINQVTAYSALGEYLKANKTIRLLESKIDQQSDRQIKAYSLLALGIILQKQGQLKKSQASLTEALAIANNILESPEIAKIKFALANTLTNLNKTEEAIALYQQIIQNSADDNLSIKAKLNLLNIYLNQKKVSLSNDLVNNIYLKEIK